MAFLKCLFRGSYPFSKAVLKEHDKERSGDKEVDPFERSV